MTELKRGKIMKRAGMATHAVSTINEGKAIRILSDFLESENKIKTFFKENDRTPNYDGSFEIINDDATPKKTVYSSNQKG